MSRTLSAMLSLLVGCVPVPEPVQLDTGASSVEEPEPEPEPEQVQWSIQPTSLVLEDTRAEQPVSGVIYVYNTGNVDLQLYDLEATVEGDLEASFSETSPLPPGSMGVLEVAWTPQVPGTLDAALSFGLGLSSDEAQAVTVPVSGTAFGAVPTLSVHSYDFGEVGIGCEVDLLVTVTNTGNSDLQIDDVGIQGGEGFWAYTPTVLPWVLAPYESRDHRAFFEPADLGSVSSALAFETDVGVVATELQGNGVVDEERTLTFDIGEQNASTIIFDVNYTAIPDSNEDRFSQYFVPAIPTFFQTLLDNNASFRTGFVWSASGTMDGPVDYIDETFTASEAADIASRMLARGANGGDNDQNFETLLAAIHENSDWLFEDEEWADSRLNLITIQNDQEQSGGHWSSWVSDARDYKDNDEDIVFHAMAGPVPSGCSGADPFHTYDQAVTATGGTFLSICSSDWDSDMAQLATACIDGPQGTYQLEGTPIAYSIEVAVDGVAMTEGWSYNEDINAVVMEEDARPDFGSSVTIYYWGSSECG
jgi:hypothetical protein